MSLTLVSGVKARTSLVSGRENLDYRDRIFLLAPFKNPATIIARSLAHYQSSTVEHHWLNKKTVPYEYTINGAQADTATTQFTLDSTTGIVPGDLLRNQTDSSHEVYLVHTIDSTTKLTVIRNYGQGEGWTTRLQAITDNAVLWKIGNAYEQGYTFPTVVSTKEDDLKNYCQMFRKGFGMTWEVIDSALRGEAEWPLEQRAKILEHLTDLDMAWFFGLPYVGDKGLWSGTHGSGDLPATMGGIDHFLIENANTDLLIDQDDLTMFEFMDALEALFQYGSREKLFYCPPAMRTGLEKWGIVKMQTFARDTVMGVPVNTWDSANGIIHFVTHDLLKAPSTSVYAYNFIVDPEQVDVVTFGRTGFCSLGEKLGYKELSGATMEKQEVMTCMGARYGQLDTMGRLRFKTISL
jgi:hypothetical protein